MRVASLPESRFERVKKVACEPKRQKANQTSENFPHIHDTQMQPWNQKSPHRNPIKNGSLSENVMKEDERILFQPFHFKRYCRG